MHLQDSVNHMPCSPAACQQARHSGLLTTSWQKQSGATCVMMLLAELTAADCDLYVCHAAMG
jgi:hypothetical protein